MEVENIKQKRIENVSKLLPGIGAIIAGVFIPLVLHINGERNRSNQLYADIISERETADSELRAKMFENLMKSFFGGDFRYKTNKEKLTLLRLMALNFHESFNLKPMFEEIATDNKLNAKEKEKLIYIAKEIVGKQEAMLSQVKEGMVWDITLSAGSAGAAEIPQRPKEAYRGHRLGITALEINKEKGYARLRVEDMPEKENIASNATIIFTIGYYDMPFIDNTKLFNHTRFAITLKDINTDGGEKIAKLKIIFFPDNYMSGRDRPYLDEMLGQIK